ncbi:Gfo/Idh/MocA family protein [Pedococcus sp. 5OH_020]|uniref:Gfo/Idh/MocA family protein n=1 Tax=Pedococcus sp. 5OH_020 TaxID=2989814 RepID=UPI0022E9EA9F|nr:Gfo/Idh/MocA family oxidoreductase [Pedococcus sp. 5OH_020]
MLGAPAPVRLAFLGCGYITGVHSRNLRALAGQVVTGYASRDRAKAREFAARYGADRTYHGYEAAVQDPEVDAVVVAVPPRLHLPLTLEALRAGKHVLVEKPAFVRSDDYELVREARRVAGRVVLVGENDHYKPLAVRLRALVGSGVIGELVLAHFATVAHRPKPADDWRHDETMAGGDAFFEEGVHWLHLANSLGPRITSIHGLRPSTARAAVGGSGRRESMLVAFGYDTGAVGALYYSREVPSPLGGVRFSHLYGREGVISFESNGGVVLVRGRGLPRMTIPGLRDVRGYQAMYRDFVGAIRGGRPPQMTLERALEDQRLMDQIYASLG